MIPPPMLLHTHSPMQVAMGQGQADVALHLLRDCASNGDWLCLKNLHLMIHWLSVLEKVRPGEYVYVTMYSFNKYSSSM